MFMIYCIFLRQRRFQVLEKGGFLKSMKRLSDSQSSNTNCDYSYEDAGDSFSFIFWHNLLRLEFQVVQAHKKGVNLHSDNDIPAITVQ